MANDEPAAREGSGARALPVFATVLALGVFLGIAGCGDTQRVESETVPASDRVDASPVSPMTPTPDEPAARPTAPERTMPDATADEPVRTPDDTDSRRQSDIESGGARSTDDVPPTAGTPVTGVTSQSASLRSAPKLDAATVAELGPGAPLDIVDQRGGWYSVRSGRAQGWLRMTHVRLSKESVSDDGADSKVVETGRSGEENIAVTSGIRGLRSDIEPPGAPTSVPIPASEPGELAGTWQLNVGLPGMLQHPVLTIFPSGEGYAGTFEDRFGLMAISQIAGDGAAFSFEVQVGAAGARAAFRYAGRVDADSISGDVRAPIGRMPFTGRRVK